MTVDGALCRGLGLKGGRPAQHSTSSSAVKHEHCYTGVNSRVRVLAATAGGRTETGRVKGDEKKIEKY